jgi:hypothetical protein
LDLLSSNLYVGAMSVEEKCQRRGKSPVLHIPFMLFLQRARKNGARLRILRNISCYCYPFYESYLITDYLCYLLSSRQVILIYWQI